MTPVTVVVHGASAVDLITSTASSSLAEMARLARQHFWSEDALNRTG
jgi:hypothetical protein